RRPRLRRCVRGRRRRTMVRAASRRASRSARLNLRVSSRTLGQSSVQPPAVHIVEAMYEVDDRDEVVELAEVPQSDVGAPCPLLVATESRLQVAYMVQRQEMFADSSIAVVTFTAPYAHMFGPPNDEAFEGHPLAERGLEPYGA